ncbi:LPS assembly protein LptD [Candidatus Pseudothioglobus singularis]|nr:LPS assembly protein LptD [Candidatus Pseudothioglobus singularis]
MKKFLLFVILMLGHFSINAEGVTLNCSPSQTVCDNCPEHQTLFPLEQFSENTGALEIEADESEILEEKYLLSGNVEVNSENLYISANDVEVSSADSSILAKGNVKFQDESYLITGDLLSASRDDNGLIATATNANYQDYSAGLGGANGYTEVIEKTPTSVLLTNSTYSLCPVDQNDWQIDADQIELNLKKNRGIADNATVKFYGIPIFYMPKYSWVLSGRGSGFLTPNYSKYNELDSRYNKAGQDDDAYSFRVPYYFNLAPDRDLLVALTYMSSRRFIYEGKYRQLIAPKISADHEDSIYSIEAKYLPEDKITGLKRWLVNFSEELDLSDKIHLSAQYHRVSDARYFEEIARTNTDVKTLKSSLKYSYEDKNNNLSLVVLTEDEQLVNAGTPVYTRALEGSVSKTLNADQKMPIQVDLVSTRFAHDTVTKESGTRTHGNLGISRVLNIIYPKVTPRASVAITNYSLKNSPNINRTILGSGLDVDFTINNETNLFGVQVNHQISPLISYNYRAKKVQGNIPLFDSTDKYDDIISFADLTSGERYTGLDRITNANDVTLSLESTYREIGASEDDKDLLSMKIAQTYFTDDEVVSDTVNTNYETRKSYSDIAASIDLSINKFSLSSTAQFNPDTSRIVKRINTISYNPSSRKFITMEFSKTGIDGVVTETEKFHGAYPLTDSIHLFGGLEKTISTGIRNTETSGIAYESCCWALRLAHFKEDNNSKGYNYSTGMELVLTGLGSSSTPLNGRIEGKIPGYKANLR